MTKAVLLNNVDHGDLRVLTGHGPAFGDNINQVLIFPTEFEEIQREYPIFFRRDANGAFQSVALLGLDRDENLFLDDRGWQARYVPALQQRGPFSIGAPADGGEPMIHVDLEHPRVSRTDGEAVFLPAGGNSPYLQRVSRCLGVVFDGLQVNGPMFETFEALGLIQAVEVEVELDDRTRYDLPELFTIDQAQLASLGGSNLERLHQSGLLRAATFVASSLANVDRLISLKNAKMAAG